MRNRRYAVVWALDGRLHPGSAEVLPDRLELRARSRAIAVPLESIAQSVIERGPSVRINGLPVLTLSLVEGDVVRIASLEGAGALRELASLSGARWQAHARPPWYRPPARTPP